MILYFMFRNFNFFFYNGEGIVMFYGLLLVEIA